MLVDEVQSGGVDHEDRGLGRPGDVRKELEHRRFGPMDVVEDDDERTLTGNVFGELRRSPVRLLDREDAAPETHCYGKPFDDV